MATQVRGVILDVDGTLVDSNDAHARAWVEAMATNGYHVPFEKVRPLIGMGGDKVLPETLGLAKDSPEGKQISQLRQQIFQSRYLPTIKAFPEAQELLQQMHEHGLKLVVATSAEPDELKSLLALVGPHVAELFEQETSSKDVKRSKPDPDIIDIALQRLGYAPHEVVMLGDTPYDIASAGRTGVKTIAFRCGGWGDHELKGAICIYHDPADLFAHYATSPLVKGV